MLIVCLCIISFIPAFDYAKYFANTLQTSAKENSFSFCRVQLSIMQILCKRAQREFILNLPSAAKYYANIILFPDISLHQANESPTLTVLILINRTIIHLLPIKSLYLHVSRRVNKQTSKQGGLHHLPKVCQRRSSRRTNLLVNSSTCLL